MKNRQKVTLYAGLFIIATMACFDISAKPLKQKSIILAFCGVVFWKHQNKPSPHTRRHIRSKNKKTSDFLDAKEADLGIKKLEQQFLNAHKKHNDLQKMLVVAKKTGCSLCIKELEQLKKRTFNEEKKYWRLTHPWLYTQKKDQHQ